MSALTNLTDAVAALGDDIAVEIAALAAAIAKSTAPAGTSDADVEASVAKLKDLSAALKASVAPAPVADPAAPTA